MEDSIALDLMKNFLYGGLVGIIVAAFYIKNNMKKKKSIDEEDSE